MPEKYKLLKGAELSIENQSLLANPLVSKLYEYAINSRKEIIVISDMYLPREFIEAELRKCGFCDYRDIFVSSEYGATKSGGDLYSIVQDKLGIDSHEITHFGDNIQSDFVKAREAGWRSMWLQNPLDCYLNSDARAKEFYLRNHTNIEVSVLMSILSVGACGPEFINSEYWWRVGYKYAGPVAWAFSDWIRRKVTEDKISDVLFVARDGYILKKVFDLLNQTNENKVNSQYIYAPRGMAVKLRRQEVKDDYRSYILSKLSDGRKIAVVDSCSNILSSQRMICETIGDDAQVYGYYWICQASKNKKYNAYQVSQFETCQSDKFAEWDVMELFMSAPELPIKEVTNGLPVYRESTEIERHKICAVKEIVNGALAFAQSAKVRELNVAFSAEVIRKWVDLWVNRKIDSETNFIASIKHSCDTEHKVYERICKPWFYGVKHKVFKWCIFREIRNENMSRWLLGNIFPVLQVERGEKYLWVKLFILPKVRFGRWSKYSKVFW